MKKTLIKLLWSQNPKISVFISALGLLLGLSILVFSINLFFVIQKTIESDAQLFSSDYLVINKKVSLLNTLSLSNSEFTQDELNEIKKQSFVKDVASFASNQFKISAYTQASEQIPGFYTELFFQSIPDKYLNINNPRWKWIEGQKEIPIIFPGDYLKLYNFGFATSQGLPQVSAETISKVPLKVRIQGKGLSGDYTARIIGLTDRVNSVLVPQAFMDWANSHYGDSTKMKNPSMLLLETPNASDPKIFTFIKDKGYETNLERLKNSKSSLFLQFVLKIVAVVGLIIVLLSVIMFILSLEILILRSSSELQKLFYLGYRISQILGIYAFLNFIILLILATLSIFIVTFATSYIIALLSVNGFLIEDWNPQILIAGSLLVSGFIFIINLLSIIVHLRRING